MQSRNIHVQTKFWEPHVVQPPSSRPPDYRQFVLNSAWIYIWPLFSYSWMRGGESTFLQWHVVERVAVNSFYSSSTSSGHWIMHCQFLCRQLACSKLNE